VTVSERALRLSQVQAEMLPKLRDLEADRLQARLDIKTLEGTLVPYQTFLDNDESILEGYDSLMELKRDYVRTEDQRGAAITKHQSLGAKSLLEQKLLAFYSSVLDDITESYVGKLEQALNEVYTYVFQNPQKSVKLALEDRYNKKVLALRLINTHEGEEHEETLSESGYSVSVVLGTVLLVYFLLYNNLERIVFFDESISGLAVDTSSRFFALLRTFTEQLGFKFMLISHETRYAEFADKVYSVRGGKFTEEVAHG
jgi:ABC-type dipeptide/oligopeptide/nickel transport system ATPase component